MYPAGLGVVVPGTRGVAFFLVKKEAKKHGLLRNYFILGGTFPPDPPATRFARTIVLAG